MKLQWVSTQNLEIENPRVGGSIPPLGTIVFCGFAGISALNSPFHGRIFAAPHPAETQGYTN